MRVVTALSLVLLAVGVNILAQSQPDTRLIFKNGTELTGKLIELKEGQYLVELPDGRRMQYSASDVEKLERIERTAPANNVARKTPCTKVLVTEATADPKYYTALKKVEVSKKFYNGADERYAELADKAGKLGADAVVEAHQWRAPSGFAWAAPHAGGLAVKWTPEGRQFAEGLDGLCSGARK